jgi:metallo-beta-lactamase class B
MRSRLRLPHLTVSSRRRSVPPASTTRERFSASASRPTISAAGGGGAARGSAAQSGARGAAPTTRTVPDRSTWYARPYKVFDNLYFIGTKIHSSWALTTSDGIIVIDTLFDYAIDPEIVDGLKTLGFDPRNIKYVLISHAHGDHDQGAALLQSRYGAKIVMGAADWDTTLQRPASAPGGVPKRDIAVGPGGQKITLGDTTVNVIATPGHTPGTLSYFFPVKDGARTLTVAYSGGTAFNFPRQSANFAIYRDSQRKMSEVAEAAGATILMTNHTEFDRAYDRVRYRAAPSRGGREASVRDRQRDRVAVFRDGGRLRRGAASLDQVRDRAGTERGRRRDRPCSVPPPSLLCPQHMSSSPMTTSA